MATPNKSVQSLLPSILRLHPRPARARVLGHRSRHRLPVFGRQADRLAGVLQKTTIEVSMAQRPDRRTIPVHGFCAQQDLYPQR